MSEVLSVIEVIKQLELNENDVLRNLLNQAAASEINFYEDNDNVMIYLVWYRDKVQREAEDLEKKENNGESLDDDQKLLLNSLTHYLTIIDNLPSNGGVNDPFYDAVYSEND